MSSTAPASRRSKVHWTLLADMKCILTLCLFAMMGTLCAAAHPDVVARLKKAFDEMNGQPRSHPIHAAEREKLKK